MINRFKLILALAILFSTNTMASESAATPILPPEEHTRSNDDNWRAARRATRGVLCNVLDSCYKTRLAECKGTELGIAMQRQEIDSTYYNTILLIRDASFLPTLHAMIKDALADRSVKYMEKEVGEEIKAAIQKIELELYFALPE